MDRFLGTRWQSSVRCLIDELYHHSSTSPQSATFDNNSQKALDALSQRWMERVAILYAEPHRAYHNMTHVQDVIASLDFLLEGEECTSRSEAILILSAFFHDVVYNPKSSTNEKDSADLFLQFASEISTIFVSSQKHHGASISGDGNDERLPTQDSSCNMVMQIEECIIATSNHISSAGKANENYNHILATFLDADMSILGKGVDIYNKYAGSIRREYEFVERNVYCNKRANVLESFLPLMDNANGGCKTGNNALKKHSYIYATGKGRQQWEEQARRNLTNEIELLRRGIIPCEIQ